MKNKNMRSGFWLSVIYRGRNSKFFYFILAINDHFRTFQNYQIVSSERWRPLAHSHSRLRHRSCQKPSASPSTSSCISLHFHQKLKPLFGFFLFYFLIQDAAFFYSLPGHVSLLHIGLSWAAFTVVIFVSSHYNYSSSQSGFVPLFFLRCCCFGRAPKPALTFVKG